MNDLELLCKAAVADSKNYSIDFSIGKKNEQKSNKPIFCLSSIEFHCTSYISL